MFSVFSNYLEPLQEAGIADLTADHKPSDIYTQLRNVYNQGVTGILNTVRMISSNEEGEDCYVLVHRCSEVLEWLQWVNKKITLEIGKENYQTLGVRLRIATSKLNKLVDNGVLTTQEAIDIHLNLADNLERENALVIDENLPF